MRFPLASQEAHLPAESRTLFVIYMLHEAGFNSCLYYLRIMFRKGLNFTLAF